MIVCVCHAVPETTLRHALEAGLTPDQIVEATRAGTSCGVCAEDVARIVSANDECKGDGSSGCAGCPRAAAASGGLTAAAA